MVEVAADSPLLGPNGRMTLLDAFEGRGQLIAYYFMWWPGRPAADQCEGCTWVMSHIGELAYLHSRDITFAVLCQGRNTASGTGDAQRSYDESLRYRTFMGWDMPWYSAQPSLDTLLVGRELGLFHLVCYLRDGGRVFETYWTKRRGAEVLDYSYALMDLTVCSAGRRNGGTSRTVGRGVVTPPGPWEGLRSGRPYGSGRAVDSPRSGHASKPGTQTILEPPTWAWRRLRIIAIDKRYAGSANTTSSSSSSTTAIDAVRAIVGRAGPPASRANREGQYRAPVCSGRSGTGSTHHSF